MRQWHGIVLIVMAFLAAWAGQAGSVASGEGRKLAPPAPVILHDICGNGECTR
ncbi:hypothetical protein [Cohnella candidum]|uniref:hypothetical protein n=1 Tax=Cohnella candidum TaxID=2674991 RepID=UPI0013DDF55E|nr:hypothetical protein [Cohnella candidum]